MPLLVSPICPQSSRHNATGHLWGGQHPVPGPQWRGGQGTRTPFLAQPLARVSSQATHRIFLSSKNGDSYSWPDFLKKRSVKLPMNMNTLCKLGLYSWKVLVLILLFMLVLIYCQVLISIWSSFIHNSNITVRFLIFHFFFSKKKLLFIYF